MNVIQKTWNEFWGELILVEVHKENPQRWSAREKKADWIFNNLELKEGDKLLDLGCGDGTLDILLARKGLAVTAVDRIQSVLDLAKTEIRGEAVNFITGDLRNLSFSPGEFDCIILFETIGLMSQENDKELIINSANWLKNNGSMIIDCPQEPENDHVNNSWELKGGRLEFQSDYNSKSRIQNIVPTFHCHNGDIIELFDPYDSSGRNEKGVVRYLYTEEELMAIIRQADLSVQKVEHYWSDDYLALVGEK